MVEYMTRCQFLLQQGQHVADVLFFGGEASPNGRGAPRAPTSRPAGYDYDACGTGSHRSRSAVKDGCVTTPVGPSKSGPAMSYRLLVMPETTWMSPKVARKIRELVKAGATVLGPETVSARRACRISRRVTLR